MNFSNSPTSTQGTKTDQPHALRVGFDRAIKRVFHGARVSSDAGLFPYRDLDDAARLTKSSASEQADFRTGNNIRHSMPHASGLAQWVWTANLQSDRSAP